MTSNKSKKSNGSNRSKKSKKSKRSNKSKAFDEINYKKGIARKSSNGVWTYYHINSGRSVSSKDLARINKLCIPPAWKEVWVSPSSRSAIQATGTDAKGRKQYRYHQFHIKKAEKEKFLRLYDFVRLMPKLNKVIKRHEQLDPYKLNRVIASVLTVVQKLHIRVGKEVYARKNKSYGVSSLRKLHMKIKDDVIKLNFRGKSKKRVSYTLKHHKLAKHLKMLLKLEGPKLFQYIDDKDDVRSVTDRDINKYLQKYLGKQFTVKDFRSAASNYYFIKTLLKETKKRKPDTDKNIRTNIKNAIKTTSHYLRHTKAISKKSYVLGLALEMYKDDPSWFSRRKDKDPELVLLELLKLYRKKVLRV